MTSENTLLECAMRDEWRRVRLGDLIGIRHGWPFKSALYSSERAGRPIVVSIGNFQYTGGFRFESTAVKEYAGDYPRAYELEAGDILLVMTCQTAGGEILGIPARVPDDGRIYLHNQRLGLVRAKSEQISLDFLYWLFLSKSFNRHLVSTASGTKILHTAPSRIESFEFDLPTLEQQRAIASALGCLQAKIDLNRRMNETLEGIARALFKSWFVDFDPVRARADDRTVKLDATTASLFPDAFERAPRGVLPRGWETTSLDGIAHFLNGLALQNYPARSGDSLPVIKIAQLRSMRTDSSDRASRDIPEEYVIHDGDLLFSWSGSLEVVVWSGGEGALNQHLFKVTSTSYPQWFVRGWLLEHLDEFRAIAAGKATTMGHIQRRHLTEAVVVVPPEALIRSVDRYMGPLSHKSLMLHLESRTLERLRDALLPKLLSGELRIRDAERVVGKAV